MTDKLLKITKADLDEDGFYTKSNSLEFDGSIEIDGGLGQVKFRTSLIAKAYIIAKAGTGIEAGWGIKAGWGIEAGRGIEAGLSVRTKWIDARLRIFAGLCGWRIPAPEEMQIEAEIRSGTIAFGTLVAPTKEESE